MPHFLCQTEKYQTPIFFSVFCLDFRAVVRTDSMDLEICAKKILENHAQKSTSKNMHDASKIVPYGLYGPAINVVVFSSIFVPSLLLSFSSICVLQNFSSYSGKMETLSLLSLSSLFSLQSAKVRQNVFPMPL